MPSFSEKIEFEKTNRVMTFFGANGLGMKFFCYIICGLDGYERMQKDYLNQTTSLPETYGEIIYQDFIPEPDAKALAFLKQWSEENSGSPA